MIIMVAGHLQQKKGYWYVVLNLYDTEGKRKTKWIATHLPVQGNKRRAEELLLQTRQQYADSQESSGLLFADYMLQWLEKMKPKVSPTTYRGYKYNIERGICPYFRQKNIFLRNLSPIDLEQYYAYLQNQGLSANTAIHHHANIHKALKDAVRLDLVSRNVADLVERPVKVNYTPNHYSADEANELLEKLHGHWLWMPVLLSLFYGLRRSEVLGLQWRSIDFTNGTILIQHARIYQETNGQEVSVGRDILKRKSSYRTLPMTKEIKSAFMSERERQLRNKQLKPEDYVCLTSEGEPISPNNYSQAFKKFLRDHGLREVRLHDLRHTCAAVLIQDRTPLIEVQQWLGHSTLETTANLYAHLEYETKLNSAGALKKI